MPSLGPITKIHPSVPLFAFPWHVVIIFFLVGLMIFTFLYGMMRKSLIFLLLACALFIALLGFISTLILLAR